MGHHEEHAQAQAPVNKNFGWWVWHAFFVLMYPVLVAFALVYTTMLRIFSGLSQVISWTIKLFSRRR
jgi:hypothetical protein